ncbi:MAG: CZB domain-containing protein [Rhodocyclaceae bacterium]|nr:CZB domain-containing protein [Rhodocyclaceae bacterium]
MNGFFRPAASLLGRFSLAGKILLMGLGFLAVIVLLAALFLTAHLDATSLTRQERAGVAAIEPTVDVIRTLQRHRGLRSRLLNGDDAAQGAVDKARSEADGAFAKAEQVLPALLSPFALDDEWRSIASAWKTLRAVGRQAPADDFAQHSTLVAKTIALIGHVADGSTLTLDPELDTFYLMDAVVFRLPVMIEDSARARGMAAGIAARKQILQQERIALAVLNSDYRQNLKVLDEGLAKVESANATLTGELAGTRDVAVKAGRSFESLIQGSFVDADDVAQDPVQTFAAGTRAVDGSIALWQLALEKLDVGLEQRIDRQMAETWMVSGIAAAMLAVVIYLFLALRTVVSDAAHRIASSADKIAAGDLGSELVMDSADEFGHIAKTLDDMRKSLGERLARDEEVAVENLRIRNALDRASVNLMLADGDGCISYVNDAVVRMLRAAEPELRKSLPSFSADRLLGANFDQFHKNPAHQRGLLANLTETHSTEIKVGKLQMQLKASPVVDGEGRRHGTVLEWKDRTAEAATEQELATLVEAAIAGDFGHRISLDGKDGFFRQLAEGMNTLTSVVARVIEDVGLVLNSLARGDLTRKVEAEYAGGLGQLRDDVNASVDQLRAVVARIQQAAEAIKGAAGEIAAGNLELSSRTEQQASSLEETASSMEEINGAVRRNADGARQANDLATTANSVASEGRATVDRVVSNMNSIQESSRKIAEIISVIDSIAFQTNILALNAAVEAARAGEQGRGFAVVASEVRSLAQRSAQAAREIKTLIDDSVGKVEDGAVLVDDAGKTMTDIVGNIQGLSQLVNGIAEASRQQSDGIDQVARAVGEMDQTTQQNAALVEEAAAAAETLRDQADSLVAAVSAFRLDANAVEQPAVAAAGKGGADFDRIIQAHMQWKVRLRDYIDGKGGRLDAGEVERDDKCELGCWIHGNGQKFAKDACFGRLRETHARFHKCAARIVRLHDRGERGKAESALGEDFPRLASSIVQEIRELRQRAEGTRIPAPPPAPSADKAASQSAGRAAPAPAAAPAKVARGAISAAAIQDEWEEF